MVNYKTFLPLKKGLTQPVFFCFKVTRSPLMSLSVDPVVWDAAPWKSTWPDEQGYKEIIQGNCELKREITASQRPQSGFKKYVEKVLRNASSWGKHTL